MARKSRGIRGKWNEENLAVAIAALRRGVSQRSVSEKYGIPRRTLRNHLKSGVLMKNMGRKSILSKEQEGELVARIIRFANVGIPLTPKLLRHNVYQFVEQNNIAHPFNKQTKLAGIDWLKAFLCRHPEISKRKAQKMNPARAQKLNRFIVKDHFDKLEQTLKSLNLFDKPESIYNMDEKGCRLTIHNQQQVLAQKGSKRVHMVAPEHAENVTVVGCGNALGNSIPPMVIYKGKRLKPEFVDSLPPRSEVSMAPKGSMTAEIFIKWLNHFNRFKTPGPALLVFDGASSHLSIEIVEVAERFDITLYCLPSNTTHELQPMDKSVFRSFEHHWDQELLRYWNQHPDRKLTKERFGTVLSVVWKKCMTMENISSGFRATGIYPFNNDILPDEAYAPSLLSERPLPPNNATNDVSSDEEDNVPLARIQARMAFNPETATPIPIVREEVDHNPVALTPENDTLSAQLTPFSVVMATPKATNKIARVPRRKAINYKAQALNRNLFNQANSKKKQTKDANPRRQAGVQHDNAQPSTSSASASCDNADSWYCPVCEENREESMRVCSKCRTWYHEECVGLVEDDEDIFVCHECVD